MDSATMTESPRLANQEGAGTQLKRIREEKNLSLDEVSRATKIKKEFLIAIEEERFDSLPGPVFARGFVRAYADYLGADGRELATRAIGRLEGQELEPPGAEKKKAAGGAARTWAMAITALGGLGAAIAYAAMHWHV